MTNNLIPYNSSDDDVVAFGEAMFRSGKLKRTIAQSFDGSVGRAIDQKLRQNGLEIPIRMIGSTRLANEHCQWFNEGISCEILNLSTRRWCKGKVRVQVSVEFYIEDSGEKMLVASDMEAPTDLPQVNIQQQLQPEADLSSDKHITGEYMFTGIRHNGQANS